MKRYVIGWALIVFAGMLVVACGITASPPKSDGSIEPSERHGNVENGTVSDQARIDLGGVKKVILPDTAVIWRTGRSGALELFMDKTLAFYGWPPRSITLVDVRNNMGCALQGDSRILRGCRRTAPLSRPAIRSRGGSCRCALV